MPAQGVRRSEDKTDGTPLRAEVQAGSGARKMGWISPPLKAIQSELEGDSKSDLELTIDIVTATLQGKLLGTVCSSWIAILVGQLAAAIGSSVARQYCIVLCRSIVVIQG